MKSPWKEESLDARRPQPPIAVFALSQGGARTAACLASHLGTELWLPSHLDVDQSGLTWPPVRRFVKVGQALRERFREGFALVCVMATGIVVRSLAPVLATKAADPAVLVLDEQGRYVIPLLSGHLGGANALAGHVARFLGAEPVLTTSSDVQGLLGPDVLAAILEAQVINPAALLPVASALANGAPVRLRYSNEELGSGAAFLESLTGYTCLPLEAPVAPDETSAGGPDPEILVSVSSGYLETEALRIVPRLVVAGVGCKRGTRSEGLVSAVRKALEEAGLHQCALRALASISAKADEPGLLDAAEELDVPAHFAPPEDIQREIERHSLPQRPFVREAVGVGAVSEPAALWAAGEGGRLLLAKRVAPGVTVALALTDAAIVIDKTRGRWWP